MPTESDNAGRRGGLSAKAPPPVPAPGALNPWKPTRWPRWAATSALACLVTGPPTRPGADPGRPPVRRLRCTRAPARGGLRLADPTAAPPERRPAGQGDLAVECGREPGRPPAGQGDEDWHRSRVYG